MCVYIQCLRPTPATALRWRTDAAHDSKPHDGRPQTAGRASMTDDRRPHGRVGFGAGVFLRRHIGSNAS